MVDFSVTVHEIEHEGDLGQAQMDICEAGGRVIHVAPNFEAEYARFHVRCGQKSAVTFEAMLKNSPTGDFAKVSR